ncbi:MAG: SDR family NAD(P)-dependent oxidoreductase [bacterium]
MKTILITGATDGIGKQTALELASMGHQILLHGRNSDRAERARDEISHHAGHQQVSYYLADLSDFKSIRQMAEQVRQDHDKIDVLLNNAGVLNMDKVILPNGLEETFMVNHLAHFSLTLQLLPLLKKSQESRIVNVSSQAQVGTIDFDNLNGEKYYDGYNAYGVSKLANCLFTYKLSSALKDTPVSVHALHPGVIATKLLHAGWGGGGAPVESGAKTTVYACVSEDLAGKTGLYFVNARPQRSAAISYDVRVQDRLWQESLEYASLDDPFRK